VPLVTDDTTECGNRICVIVLYLKTRVVGKDTGKGRADWERMGVKPQIGAYL